ncbi:Hypothetical protein RG1141_CH01810 [Neorhizobium galegae bv. officinalis bv. officinalis str. HAMBI 1141]|uniref:DUF4376 domain-containing protein n=2 Tax=Neorhizobium galegae TaxID=399 RepID=A0A068T3D8_NEOGA|nr:Hypothetical protein RG1141_CH01810 [Neorhizobium galegae bv. officinalis bv. officinalis str. HAMBI 1141]
MAILTTIDILTGETTQSPYTPAPGPALDQVKVRLKAIVDADAEIERLKYITAGAGQAMTYQQKADEAREYLEEDQPDAADYPLLTAEIGITGATIADVANVIIASFQQWQVIGGAIEAARLGTKAAIDAAETVDDAEAAANAIFWPAP